MPAASTLTNPVLAVVLDDSSDVRHIVRMALEIDRLFEVVGVAGDGRAGVAVVEQTQPAVVLLDMMMPVLDGLAALPLIKQVSPRSKVVVLSGIASETWSRRARDSGADAFVQKGVPLEDLVTEVSRVVGGTT